MSLEHLRQVLGDRYAIERELGHGGMGTVYLAEDLKHRRQVALKILPPEFARALGGERFLREIETAARLAHPHILPLHDSGEAGGVLYFVMPYVEGETLRQRLEREGRLPVDEALRIAAEIAEGLDYAHRQGVVHRDIKPENVLLQDGHAVVADFGVARAVSAAGGTALTQTGAIVGTPVYMSPEQATGDVEVDGRSDVYSLGCVLYEMLVGRPPFEGPSLGSLIHQHLSEEPRPVTVVRPEVPRAVAEVLTVALAKDRARRFATAGDLAVALRRRAVGGWAAPAVSGRVIVLVATATVLLVGVAIWMMSSGRGAGGRVASLAVLPLENLSADSGQDYFVDGMTEALITNLAQIGALKVISRTSVMRYRGERPPVRQIGRELEVDAIVEGSVLRAGGRVRITAQLVDARADRHLWADSYERDLTDVLALQMNVARDIADRIRVVLSPQERERLVTSRAVHPDAYEAYLRGRFHWSKRTREGFETAIREFQRAIAIDPGYAAAYAGLADCHIMLVEWRHVPPVEGVPLAKAAALRALELDSLRAEAYTSLGEIAVSEWDWEGAERAFRRALELNPGYATARQWYGFFLSKMGRHQEAIEQLQRAVELDPLSMIIRTEFGRVYHHARRYEDALRVAQRALEIDADFVDIHWLFGVAYEGLGRYDEAIAAFRRAAGQLPVPVDLARTLARAGRTREARAVLAGILAQRDSGRYLSPAPLAQVYVALGENERALQLLERAYANGSTTA